MMKSQDTLTFDEAKQAATGRLRQLVTLAEHLDNTSPHIVLAQHAVDLATLESIVQKSQSRCLSDDQINEVLLFVRDLTALKSSLTPKLQNLWNMYQDIAKLSTSKAGRKPFAPMQFIGNLIPEMNKIADLGNSIQEHVNNNLGNMLAPASLMLLHMITVETIDNAIVEQLEDHNKTFELKYDIAEMCSVNSKVQKGTDWKTDVRAVRDAIAHNHFIVTFNATDWEIEFNNREKGWNFCKKFNRKEFMQFFDNHTLLHTLQIHLMFAVETLSILRKHFKK